MQNSLFRKALVSAIICLFIGAGVLPSISGNIVNIPDSEKIGRILLNDGPDVEWEMIVGTEDLEDVGYSVCQTSDGGYILTGGTRYDMYSEEYNGDIWLIKVDEFGNKQWDKTFGGEYYDIGLSVQQTSDGGYAVIAYTWDGQEDRGWLIKTDSDGNMEWDKKIKGGSPAFYYAYSVQQTHDGGYIIATSLALIKTDGNGNIEWEKTHNVGEHTYFYYFCAKQTSDYGYIITGKQYVFGDIYWDALLMKIDKNGNMQWNKTLGGEHYDEVVSVQQTHDGGYIMAGWTDSYGAGIDDAWLIKTDNNGNEMWNKTFGGSKRDSARSVQQTTDNGFILVGFKSDYNNWADVWFIKTDSDGNMKWDTLLDTNGKHDYGYSVQQTHDGGYIIAGSGNSIRSWYGDWFSDVWLIKLTSEDAPTKPTITGPTSGKAGEEYTYKSTATDPNGDQIYYKFDWGDGSYTNTELYNSGDEGSASHKWEEGSYEVKVKAIDEHGAVSVWSDLLSVSMPKVRNIKEVNMNKIKKYIVLAMMRVLILPAMQNVISANAGNCNNNDNGYTLFSPMTTKTTYLIDAEGEVLHTWDSEYLPGNMAYLIDDGCIVRAGRDQLLHGGVQKITWGNEVVWDFTFACDRYEQHHDIEPMPNGNVLLVAREFKARDEAIYAGRAPDTITKDVLSSDFIVEVKPTGPTSGEIVWEWHAWDHLIQNYDETKDNFGVVEDHPELIDINWAPTPKPEWIHLNSVDYNQELDQIMLSSRGFDEIWIIDHSTTKDEASGHTGGKIGKGGDIIYRWGNPLAYGAGTSNDQKLFDQHDATWIDKGCPGEGNVLVFNNGASSVDEIVPPVDENGFYNKTIGFPYGPCDAIWRYNNHDIYSELISGAQRLPNGNTLICSGKNGYFIEVTFDKKVVWEYTNLYGEGSDSVFKVRRYYEIFNDSNPPKSPTIYGPAKGKKGVMYSYTISTTDPNEDNIYYYIEWGDGSVEEWIGPYESGEEVPIVHTWANRGTYTIRAKAKNTFGFDSDWATLEVSMPRNKPFINTPFLQFLQNHPLIYQLLQRLL